MFFATARGVVKKTPLGAYSRPRANGIIAMTLDPDDELIGVGETSGTDEIVLGSRSGLAIRFDEDDVRAMGRTARGVKGMDLRGDDLVVDLVVTNEEASLLTVCENGFGKRTQVSEYRKTRRGAKGVINIKTTERNGQVVSVIGVNDTDEVLFISAKGIILRTDLSQVREIGRATQGIRLIRLDDNDQVVAATRMVSEDENGKDDESEQAKSAETGDGTPSADASNESLTTDETPDSSDTDTHPAGEEDGDEAS